MAWKLVKQAINQWPQHCSTTLANQPIKRRRHTLKVSRPTKRPKNRQSTNRGKSAAQESSAKADRGLTEYPGMSTGGKVRVSLRTRKRRHILIASLFLTYKYHYFSSHNPTPNNARYKDNAETIQPLRNCYSSIGKCLEEWRARWKTSFRFVGTLSEFPPKIAAFWTG